MVSPITSLAHNEFRPEREWFRPEVKRLQSNSKNVNLNMRMHRMKVLKRTRYHFHWMFLFSRDFAFASACKENIKSYMIVTKLSNLAFPRKNGQRPGSFPTYEQKTKFVSSLCLGETILVLGEFWIISESRSGRIEFMSGQNHSHSGRSASWVKLV